MGAKSGYLSRKVLDHTLGVAAYAQPTPYVSLHAPLVLQNNAASGASSIDLQKNDQKGNAFTPIAGSYIRIGTEKFKLGTITDNTTYWTAALLDVTTGASATLASAYSAGDYVGYRGKTTMPTELNYTGYARQSATFSAATGDDPATASNSADINFGDPDVDGAAGSFAIYDAPTLGNMLRQEVLDAVVNFQAAVSDTLQFAAGSLIFTES